MIPIIISGGSGTRLWPISTKTKPKQFSSLLDEPLFNKTYKRLHCLGTPWVITTDALSDLTEQSLQELDHKDNTILLEPFAANTAAAIGLLCKKFEELGLSEAIVGIFPADHFIQDTESFIEHVKVAEKYAQDGHVVTLGIQATYPATGYGYIELIDNKNKKLQGVEALRFREKPSIELATEFLSNGNFVWNAGMFIFRISTMTDLFKKYQPELYDNLQLIDKVNSNIEDIYKKIQKLSFDVAIMENLKSHICIPCSFSWSDIGSWDSLIDNTKDFEGKKIEISAHNNSVVGNIKKSYSFVSVSDLIIIDTDDALVVMQKGKSELIKQVVDKVVM